MTNFASAVQNQSTRTANGMKARKSTANACVDLFFKIGASRGKNIVPEFVAAYAHDRELALRIVQWARDVRGGAGERQIFRDILQWLDKNDTEAASVLINKIPELGRFDDLFVFTDKDLKAQAYMVLGDALRQRNGLAAKWTPRQGPVAVELRKFFGMTPKQYRKSLVALTNVVETQMCAKDWDNINFNQVPSLAHARYKRAFGRNTTKYGEYVQRLVKGEDGAKVNAGAVYPYDVLKGRINHWKMDWSKTELDLIQKQWEALPNFVGDANILPLVDVSGSMCIPAGKNINVTCIDISVSLGLYLADKNTGKFKDMFLTFSENPELMLLKGDINQKIDQMIRSKWGMNTNLHKAFDKILKTAIEGNVPHEEMPKMLLILSDMQFDACVTNDDTALSMIERKYTQAGYELPKVVFWNLNAYDNVPVKFDQKGTALVSGFSPAIMKSILAGDADSFSPEAIMLKTVMVERYDL